MTQWEIYMVPEVLNTWVENQAKNNMTHVSDFVKECVWRIYELENKDSYEAIEQRRRERELENQAYARMLREGAARNESN